MSIVCASISGFSGMLEKEAFLEEPEAENEEDDVLGFVGGLFPLDGGCGPLWACGQSPLCC